jgi:hypothetical protein
MGYFKPEAGMRSYQSVFKKMSHVCIASKKGFWIRARGGGG